MDETIYSTSPIGKRLESIKRRDSYCLLFQGKKIPLVAKVSIGRDRTNCITIENALVSRWHAELHKIKEDYYIRDLYSSNGTFLNGKKIKPNKYYKVAVDDTIGIANTELKIIL
ncbi:FHA domain-containing protein [Marispirochaeta aestuarii]|uniref:FHA domain-containing protein n=1 Tax=Marispirochaeta aestuarii TaxID=1963862 RepID=UPI0029C90BD3|nr:FHA domain-containing protein [Marispirochaeta aestuarii]